MEIGFRSDSSAVCHRRAMRPFQVLQGTRIKPAERLVSLAGVPDLLDFLLRQMTIFPLTALRTSSGERELASMAGEEWMGRMRLLRCRCGFVSSEWKTIGRNLSQS